METLIQFVDCWFFIKNSIKFLQRYYHSNSKYQIEMKMKMKNSTDFFFVHFGFEDCTTIYCIDWNYVDYMHFRLEVIKIPVQNITRYRYRIIHIRKHIFRFHFIYRCHVAWLQIFFIIVIHTSIRAFQFLHCQLTSSSANQLERTRWMNSNVLSMQFTPRHHFFLSENEKKIICCSHLHLHVSRIDE